jgi:heat shock protein HslJ
VTEQESSYLAALHRVARYALGDETLTLEDSHGVPLLIYAREPPPLLAGTDWRLATYNDGKGGFVSARRDVTATATFGADGKLSGSGGCNDYHGKYSQSGDTLTIGTLILTTRKPCAGETKDQERAYLASLRSATRAEMGGDQLMLFRAGDTRVAGFVRIPDLPAAR